MESTERARTPLLQGWPWGIAIPTQYRRLPPLGGITSCMSRVQPPWLDPNFAPRPGGFAVYLKPSGYPALTGRCPQVARSVQVPAGARVILVCRGHWRRRHPIQCFWACSGFGLFLVTDHDRPTGGGAQTLCFMLRHHGFHQCASTHGSGH